MRNRFQAIATALWIAPTLLAAAACTCPERPRAPGAASGPGPTSRPSGSDPWRERRLAMVRRQIAERGVREPRVLSAMRRVPRHLFVPRARRELAYDDRPLPIGHGQTISQPYVVAFMSEALQLHRSSRVLEIGTGSGYQAAVLAELAAAVYTIEIVPALARRATALFEKLGYRNISIRTGDGYHGWPERAPFDRVILTAAPPAIPRPLLHQLKVGGILVAPVGRSWQNLVRWRRTSRGFTEERLLGVRFVPMTGEAQRR